jgi:hypothetical protein
MPSRQERRRAARDAAKRAPGARAAGAAGAAAALADVNMNPVGDWTTETADPYVLFEAVGAEIVNRRAADGDRDGQYSQGFKLVSDAEDAGSELGAAGRSPKADVGLPLCTVSGSPLRLRRVFEVT